MFLKSLNMKGFKSFADPTVLEFEPGITVVVGPNGSGKSNVVDAVTWVLGAQGPRSLRSQKMEDVIFAGTSSRAALGRAEVSLTIDNASGRLPVDVAEVTITRTLFRSGDSEYAINGTPCRLLDIQDLLSDTGVGRQQHMIIGQGQLDTILNARPEDRRAIIEEAAGVLKHRRRRERAERRLAATHDNLDRLGDLVREVRRQIRPLERQAEAARTHGALADELAGLRAYLAGRELDGLGATRTATGAELATLTADQRRLEAAVRATDADAAAIAAELSSRRDEDLASLLARVEGLVERSRGTGAVLAERRRAHLAALDAAADADVVSSLEADAARLATELEAARADEAALEPVRAELDGDETRLAADEAAHEVTFPPGRRTAAELATAMARLDLLRRSAELGRATVGELSDRRTALVRRRDQAELGRRNAAEAVEGHRHAVTARRTEHNEAEVVTVAAAAEERAAEQAADEAEGIRHRSAARAEALARALEELQGAGGREVVDGVDGVLGSLADLVEIDAGWEAAFQAAAGASVAAVVVDGREAARRVLARLRDEGVTGAVLAAGNPGALTPLPERPAAWSAAPVRAHVRARPAPVEAGSGRGVAEVLDVLVGRAVRVARWEDAVDLSLAHPELVVVTPEGDRFAATGWRVRSGRPFVTAASVDEARGQASEAGASADAALERLRARRLDHEAARRGAEAAARAHHRAEVDLRVGETELIRLDEERHRQAVELDALDEAFSAAAARLADDEGALGEIEGQIEDLEGAAAAEAEAAAAAEAALEALAARADVLEGRRRELAGRTARIAERQRVLSDRAAEVERRLAGHVAERAAAARRRHRLELEGRALVRLEAVVAAERARCEEALAGLRAHYRSQLESLRSGGERLEALRRQRAGTESELEHLRDQIRTLDLRAAEVAVRMDALADAVRRELGRAPEDLRGVECPELPEGVDAVAHAAALEARLARLGPVNPLALEELTTLEARHQELEAQVSDIRTARRELQEVVRTLDEEIMQSFAAAVADVNEHFSVLVESLFPGGRGRLSLTEPEDLLNTGVEVEVRPAGRNVRRVSLLSGGERSLAALAFLFAVFRSRPSPFYLMDEVEAALDDVNLSRFLALVREFRDEAQLIIVSHQKRTMETADALYGVTMAPGGSTQVLSQRIARAAGVG